MENCALIFIFICRIIVPTVSILYNADNKVYGTFVKPPIIDKLVHAVSPSQHRGPKISEDDKGDRCLINHNSYVCSMHVNRLLTPLIWLAERYNIDTDVRLDDHTPVGLWLMVSVEDIQWFHEAFEDKVLLDA